jgi:DNA-binding CsgD family transcriptional regulator
MTLLPWPNAPEGQLAEVIRRIGASGFESALAGFFRRAIGSDSTLILAFRDSDTPTMLFRQSDRAAVFAALQDVYLAGAYLLDPFHALHLARAPAGLYRLADIAPDAFQRSRYVQEYYRQTTLVDELTFVAYPRAGVSININLGRDVVTARGFSAREMEFCQRMAPILSALVEAHWADLALATPGSSIKSQPVTAQLILALGQNGVTLSPRQAEVALLILQGHSTPSIGLRMGVSPQTVKVFRKQLYSRCGITSQAELFALLLPILRQG